MTISHDEAIQILRKYNKEIFHLEHAITVGKVMKWMASDTGHKEKESYWEAVGILHDIDFELYPNEHCKKCIDLLKENNIDDETIHSICSHGYGICSDIEPKSEMEKILYAVDELTGIIFASAKMRPSKSCEDMELSSLKKKFKDKKFAAGCSRDIINNGAKNLAWDIDVLLQKTLDAMKYYEKDIKNEVNSLL
ncbi:MAG: hydrolase [Eubacteriales bacterium]|nr:hydrolase [Eubacteriales bacterium]